MAHLSTYSLHKNYKLTFFYNYWLYYLKRIVPLPHTRFSRSMITFWIAWTLTMCALYFITPNTTIWPWTRFLLFWTNCSLAICRWLIKLKHQYTISSVSNIYFSTQKRVWCTIQILIKAKPYNINYQFLWNVREKEYFL